MKFRIPLHTYQGRPWCGGIILGSKTILTAAHCIEDIPTLPNKDYFIEAGITKWGNLGFYGQKAFIESYTIHPNWAQCKFLTGPSFWKPRSSNW